MVSTFSPNINLEEPGHNDYVNTWDVPVNANWTLLDHVAGGTLLLNATALSGAQALTNIQLQPRTIQISGAPSAAVTYTVPASVGGQWIVRNTTTGGFNVGLASAAGGSTVLVPANQQLQMWCDGSATGMLTAQTITLVGLLTGVLFPFAGSTAPSWALLCFGQAVSRTTYAALFLQIGTTYGIGDGTTTFNLPDLRGRVPAGMDIMGGSANANRLSSVIASTVLGSAGGQQLNSTTVSVGGSTSGALSVSASGSGGGTQFGDWSSVATAQAGASSAQFPTVNATSTVSVSVSVGGSTSGSLGVSAAGSSAAFSTTTPTMVMNYIIGI